MWDCNYSSIFANDSASRKARSITYLAVGGWGGSSRRRKVGSKAVTIGTLARLRNGTLKPIMEDCAQKTSSLTLRKCSFQKYNFPKEGKLISHPTCYRYLPQEKGTRYTLAHCDCHKYDSC